MTNCECVNVYVCGDTGTCRWEYLGVVCTIEPEIRNAAPLFYDASPRATNEERSGVKEKVNVRSAKIETNEERTSMDRPTAYVESIVIVTNNR